MKSAGAFFDCAERDVEAGKAAASDISRDCRRRSFYPQGTEFHAPHRMAIALLAPCAFGM